MGSAAPVQEIPPLGAPPTPQQPATQRLLGRAEQIQNPFLRTVGTLGAGILRGADVLGGALAPNMVGRVPGSTLNTTLTNEQRLEDWQKNQQLNTGRLAVQQKPELSELQGEIRGQLAGQTQAASEQRQQERLDAQNRAEQDRLAATEKGRQESEAAQAARQQTQIAETEKGRQESEAAAERRTQEQIAASERRTDKILAARPSAPNEAFQRASAEAASKDVETARGGDFRYRSMAGSLPKAQGGDQQAMVNLLTNHIGMTLGMQKGARITKDILNEAQKSTPWLQGVKAKWGSDGYLSGVTLTPEQMKQMMDLAVQQRSNAWAQAIESARQGGVADQLKLPSDVRIRVQSPDGKIGSIPAGQLNQAEDQGYVVAPQ